MPPRQANRILAPIAAVSAMLLGATALIGRFLHSEALQSIAPGALPMKPNMAAGFLLCGATLVLLSRKTLTRTVRGCAIVIATSVSVLAALILGEHLFGWHFPIEKWLLGNVPPALEASHPGRVNSATALGFLLAGISLLMASLATGRQRRLSVVIALGTGLLIMGIVPLAAFLLEVSFGPQWNFMGMNLTGVPCAIGFTFLASGLFALLQNENALRWALNAQTTLGFAVGFLLIIVAVAAAFDFSKRMLQTTSLLAHRQEVLKESQEVATSVTKLTSWERLYVLTGNEQFLTERQQPEHDLREDLSACRKLTDDDPTQRRRLDELERIINEHLDWEQRVITCRRDKGLDAGAAMVATGIGVALANKISVLINDLQTEEYHLLEADEAQAESASNTAFSLLPMGLFLCLAILSLCVFLLNAGVWQQKQAEQKYRGIFENSIEGIFQTTPEGTYISANPALARIYGYESPEELMSVSDIGLAVYVDPERRNDFKRLIEAQGFVSRFEYEVRRKDGSTGWLSENARTVRDSNGAVAFYEGAVEDCTNRKRAEDALRASEAQLQTIVENLDEGVVVSDLQGQLVHWNQAALNIHGLTNVKEAWRALGELVDTFELEELDGTPVPLKEWPLTRILRGEKLRDLELRVKNIKTGSERIFNYGGTLVHDANDQSLMAIVAMSDITERKDAEKMLRSSEERYRTLFESNPHPMWVYDLETLSFLAVNTTAVTHYGYSREEFLAMTIKDIRPTQDVPALMSNLSGQTVDASAQAPWRHQKKDGSVIEVEITSHELLWLGRRAQLVMANDVTERKRAEERLREQADMLNRAHDAIIVRNFHDERITFWSSGAERVYGWTVEEAMGRPIGEVVPTDEKQRGNALSTLIATGEFHGEFKQVSKDGREIIADCRATLVRDAAGVPRSVLLINADVTEQTKLKTQLLRSQRLESIGTLASGVAHDLNNILTPILVCADTLRGDLGDEDRESAISLIEGSARRGANVVKQVLTFARGVEGERILINPTHLVEEIVDIARKTLPKSIVINSRYPENLWCVQGDPTQLHQVLLNLCVNARDAMPDGGMLTFSAENFEADEHYAAMNPDAKAGLYLALWVSDTGMGIPQATLEKIFDPFFTTKGVGKGTGLGLSTSLGIVKSHGGFISVYSERGKGTTFKVFLPASTSEEDVQKSKTPTKPVYGSGEQILVVDDEESILRSTRMIFEKNNYQVLCASDGPEALAIFAQQMPFIGGILTDISMPYMDGVALIRAIRKMKSDVPIIASTGQGERSSLAELASLGVKNFLTKPYNSEKLLTTVYDTLHERISADPES